MSAQVAVLQLRTIRHPIDQRFNPDSGHAYFPNRYAAGAKAAGLDWVAVLCPLPASLDGVSAWDGWAAEMSTGLGLRYVEVGNEENLRGTPPPVVAACINGLKARCPSLAVIGGVSSGVESSALAWEVAVYTAGGRPDVWSVHVYCDPTMFAWNGTILPRLYADIANLRAQLHYPTLWLTEIGGWNVATPAANVPVVDHMLATLNALPGIGRVLFFTSQDWPVASLNMFVGKTATAYGSYVATSPRVHR